MLFRSVFAAPMARAQVVDRPLPYVDSLQGALTLALTRRQPLVVMVSLEGCPFCRVARTNYLRPILGVDGLQIVQVDMRDQRAISDFQGRPLSHDALVRQWSIKIAPTVLFFGKGGVEVAGRLEGGYIPDFYGAYLEEHLAQARNAIRNSGR